MKVSKRMKALILALVLSFIVPISLPTGNIMTAQAAVKVKLDKTTLKLGVGDTVTLHMKGTKSKVTWSSDNKTVATVSKAGKVTAKSIGAAIITATINKKKYTCVVYVVSSLVKNAPFDAQEVPYKDFSFVIPSEWSCIITAEDGNNADLNFKQANADTTNSYSDIMLTFEDSGEQYADYNALKEDLASQYTEKAFIDAYQPSFASVSISDFTTSDYESNLGTCFKASYHAVLDGVAVSQEIYSLKLGNYLITIISTKYEDDTTLDVFTVGEYLLSSLQTVEK